MKILGIDPGIGITGYSLIDYKNGQYELVSSGSIQTDKAASHPKRLVELANDMQSLIKQLEPECCSIEQLFFFKNQKTIIPVAQARGVILYCLEQNNIPIYEYTPLVVKQTITGHGRADKTMVKLMVKNFINIGKNVKLDDTIDSIALGICHGQNLEFKEKMR